MEPTTTGNIIGMIINISVAIFLLFIYIRNEKRIHEKKQATERILLCGNCGFPKLITLYGISKNDKITYNFLCDKCLPIITKKP